jgi:hypothetical protein
MRNMYRLFLGAPEYTPVETENPEKKRSLVAAVLRFAHRDLWEGRVPAFFNKLPDGRLGRWFCQLRTPASRVRPLAAVRARLKAKLPTAGKSPAPLPLRAG